MRHWLGMLRPFVLMTVLITSQPLFAQDEWYERPVETAPQADDIGGGYAVPPVQRPLPRADWLEYLDVGVMAVMLLATAFVLLRLRNRKLLAVISLACLAYFGFYREGCVCPIGATQNIAVALTDPSYAVPRVVIALFVLPLVMALLFGRVFCGGVCPLGAIQDLVAIKPIQLPRRLDKFLGLFKFVYLGLAIWFAIQPIASRDFVICRFDPFVGLFRMTGTGTMLMLGGGLLVLGLVIGRPYCRFLCPYGALLSIFSRFAWRGVTISPSEELDCGLCAKACPFGAIEKMRAINSSCLSCARCYASCPKEQARRGLIGIGDQTAKTPVSESTEETIAVSAK